MFSLVGMSYDPHIVSSGNDKGKGKGKGTAMGEGGSKIIARYVKRKVETSTTKTKSAHV